MTHGGLGKRITTVKPVYCTSGAQPQSYDRTIVFVVASLKWMYVAFRVGRFTDLVATTQNKPVVSILVSTVKDDGHFEMRRWCDSGRLCRVVMLSLAPLVVE